MGKLGWFMSDINRNIPTTWWWASIRCDSVTHLCFSDIVHNPNWRILKEKGRENTPENSPKLIWIRKHCFLRLNGISISKCDRKVVTHQQKKKGGESNKSSNFGLWNRKFQQPKGTSRWSFLMTFLSWLYYEAIYLFMKVSFNPGGWLGSKHQVTN